MLAVLDLDFLSVNEFMYHSYHNFTCIAPCLVGSLWKRCDSAFFATSSGSCICRQETLLGKYTVRYQFRSISTSPKKVLLSL